MTNGYAVLTGIIAGGAFVAWVSKPVELKAPAASAAPIPVYVAPAPKAPTTEEALAAAAKLIAANTPADTREIRLVRKPVPAPRTIKITVE
jgi:hypothetical protein